METIVEIFWTGGYDSTFRICQLSKHEVTIRPYYMSDKRKSEEYELSAINAIREKLLKNPGTKAKIEPIIFVSVEERHNDDRITKAFQSLLKQDFMGSQYEWLAVFALRHPGIELSIHKDDKAIALINKHGALKMENGPYGSYYVIDTEKSSEDLNIIFGREHFPLVDYTKIEMKKEYASLGLSDVIKYTWFCHTPINGEPCGMCNPCQYTIQEGMSERFSPEALKRYHNRNKLAYRIIRRIKMVVSKLRASKK